MTENSSISRLKAAKMRIADYAKASPEIMKSMGTLSAAAIKAGQFSTAERELVAVAIAVVTHCDDCIVYHLDAARRHGAEEAQLVEALDVAIEMGGGPTLMYAARALEIFKELKGS